VPAPRIEDDLPPHERIKSIAVKQLTPEPASEAALLNHLRYSHALLYLALDEQKVNKRSNDVI
jgi:hypothetical protein